MAGIEADARDLHRLSRDLRAADKKLEKAMKKEMAAVAEPIRRRVAAEASWSKRIPGATKVSTRFTARTQNVLVTVNRKQAPHARALENQGRPGTFEHPTPNGGTARQQARPFFERGVKAADHRIDEAINEIADRYIRELGFR